METSKSNPILVMVVDDSAVVRGLISRMLEQDADIKVIETASNGELAVKKVKENDMDIIILDIEMPVMDGLTALPEILKIRPTVKVIMASTLTMKNAEISLKALQAGAAEYIAKPSTSRELTGGQDFGHELCQKVKALGLGRPKRSVDSPPSDAQNVTASVVEKSVADEKPSGPITLRPLPVSYQKPNILAVGSSTGGPQALFELFKGLNGKIKVPIVVTQHMPPTFTTILAQHISRTAGIPTAEAKEGDKLEAGKVLIAPGDYHMILKDDGGEVVVTLNQDPPVNFCRPAVDPMMESVVRIYGKRALGVILTGMGYDGRDGCRPLVEAGGVVFAQDEESSVVWGMPGAVAEAGLCSAVLPLPELAPHIISFIDKGVG